MNRRERRATAKNKTSLGPPAYDAAIEPPKDPPSLLLKALARLILSPWVLNRIRHPEVERLLISVAIQAGQPEKARSLVNRINMRDNGG
jgi:hypothetical protein